MDQRLAISQNQPERFRNDHNPHLQRQAAILEGIIKLQILPRNELKRHIQKLFKGRRSHQKCRHHGPGTFHVNYRCRSGPPDMQSAIILVDTVMLVTPKPSGWG